MTYYYTTDKFKRSFFPLIFCYRKPIMFGSEAHSSVDTVPADDGPQTVTDGKLTAKPMPTVKKVKKSSRKLAKKEEMSVLSLTQSEEASYNSENSNISAKGCIMKETCLETKTIVGNNSVMKEQKSCDSLIGGVLASHSQPPSVSDSPDKQKTSKTVTTATVEPSHGKRNYLRKLCRRCEQTKQLC